MCCSETSPSKLGPPRGFHGRQWAWTGGAKEMTMKVCPKAPRAEWHGMASARLSNKTLVGSNYVSAALPPDCVPFTIQDTISPVIPCVLGISNTHSIPSSHGTVEIVASRRQQKQQQAVGAMPPPPSRLIAASRAVTGMSAAPAADKPPAGFYLDVLKGGDSIQVIPLGKQYLRFGRSLVFAWALILCSTCPCLSARKVCD